MKISTKSCPNCGANLKFNLNSEYAICRFCNSQIKIGNKKNIKNEKDYLYVNKSFEVFKWIMSLLHLPFTILIACLLIKRSNPIFSILIIIGGILSIPGISNLVFKKNRILKIVFIELLIIIGIFGAALTNYPFVIHGKLYSNISDKIIEFKGNYIIIEEDGKKTKEKYNYKEDASLGDLTCYTIKTDKYTFNYCHHSSDSRGINDKFYLMDGYDKVEWFYTKRQLEVFGDELSEQF